MCQFCKDVEGNLDEPILCKSKKLGPLTAILDAWVWNKDKKGKLWISLDLGNETIFDVKVPIRYCPNCGRNLEV